MSYAPSLESRYCDPIILPVIPRREIVIPIPRLWFDEINAGGMDVGCAVARLVSSGLFSYSLPGDAKPRNDFPAIWTDCIACEPIPETCDWVKALVPIREDVWRCLYDVAEMVECTVHEVFIKCLARQLKLRRAEIAAPASSIPKSRKATRPAHVANVIPFSVSFPNA